MPDYPFGATIFNGPFLFFSNPKLNFTSAESHCMSLGFHLASAHTPEENAKLTSLCNAENAECWIGLNDIEQEGSWVWAAGVAPDFSAFPDQKAPWQPGEPNGLPWEKTDGAYVYPASNAWVTAGAWDDDDIAIERAFVCRTTDAHPWRPSSPPPPPRPTQIGPFKLVERKAGWAAAESECELLEGHLASIHSHGENEAVLELCEPNECWIGLHDVDRHWVTDSEYESHWVWADGAAADFNAWNPGEPNGQPGEPTTGAYMYPAANPWVVGGSWDDDDVGQERVYPNANPRPGWTGSGRRLSAWLLRCSAHRRALVNESFVVFV